MTKPKYFVPPNSIMRQIWGKADTILLIFCGASAEFALNKAVDWLYFTEKLPSDPLARLFSTVTYAKQIIFATEEQVIKAIQKINSIHGYVETSRGSKIPDWAYRDVLYMLIDYSIKSFELLERPLKMYEKEAIFVVFKKLGQAMNIPNLPENYNLWLTDRQVHLNQNMIYSKHTQHLFEQYRLHLGFWRYEILVKAQNLILPEKAQKLMGYHKSKLLLPFIKLYKFLRNSTLAQKATNILMPKQYLQQILNLNND